MSQYPNIADCQQGLKKAKLSGILGIFVWYSWLLCLVSWVLLSDILGTFVWYPCVFFLISLIFLSGILGSFVLNPW